MAYTQTNSPSTTNTIGLSEVMTGELDKAIVQQAVTGVFADNQLKAKFMGNGIVILDEIDMSGLGDYDRDDGFVLGSVTNNKRPYQLTKERGRSFQIDAQDADESGIGDLAGKVMSEFVRTKVVPEIDAYCLSKLAGVATANGHADTTYSANGILADLMAAQNGVFDACGYESEDVICFVNPTVWAALQSTTEITRRLEIIDFKKGELLTKVKALNGMPLLPVSSARMKTAYTFNDGTTDGQTAGGFTPASGAKEIGFLMLPKRSASLVKKTEKTRIFSPDQNQTKDAWKLDYRLYYDIFVKNSLKNTIFAQTYTAS
jgi:hypothetical protein